METIHAAVATRLVPPRQSRRSIAREVLLQRLHDARHGRLTLLTAPAGYGKTTVMAQWRHRLLAGGARVAWLTLAPEDDDLGQFCASLDASLRQAGIRLCRPGPEFGFDPAHPAALLPAFVALLDGVPGEVYLMLDGLDRLRHPATLAFLQGVLCARLPHLHIVAAARGEAGLALARLRADRELAEAGRAELAFSVAETLAFVGQRVEGRIARRENSQAAVDTAVALQEVTEGWPAGLELVAASLRTGQEPAWPHAQSAALHAYWQEEVTAGLPPALLDFMRCLAVPRRIHADLAALLAGCAQAPARLAEIAARGLFLEPAPPEPDEVADGSGQGWYRFHPLFRAHLLHDLEHGTGPGPHGLSELQRLHGLASAWLDRCGKQAEAIGHALCSGDFGRVLALVEATAAQLPGVSPLRDFLQWADGIAPAQLALHPALLLASAWACVVSVRPQHAEHWIRRWEASAGPGVDTVVHATVMRATIAAQQDDHPRVQVLLDSLQGRPPGNPALEQIRMSLALRYGTLLGCQPRSRAPYRCAAQPGDTEIALMGAGTLALMAWIEGNAYETLRLGTDVLAAAQHAYGRRSIAASLCAVPVAAALYEQDRIAEASEVLAGRLQTLRTGTPDVLIEAALCHARLQWLAGARHEALAELVEAEAMFHRRGLPRGVARVAAERQRLTLLGKDLRHAQRLQASLEELGRQDPGATPRGQEIAAVAALARARLALAQGEPTQALAALGTVRGLYVASVREPLLVTVDLLQATALDDLYRSDEAAPYLEAALAAGERLGLVRTFLDEGERTFGLLARMAGREDGGAAGRGAYLARLCEAAAMPAPPPGPAEPSAEPAAAPAALPPADVGKGRLLTPREREILALLEQSMSNKRIALVLNLSVDTVKWNLRQIYAKLDVSRRYDAILVARSALQRPG
ncbi:LuxR C-terminal-related transcriptional regulator [Cupriavidus sp. SK-4]|uniref:LuxR C-terminal-related transcriptional regulator n=1 Tax=Cupriavidus sp. SK-4 TaxID=574750 RepID=UPI001268F529|nr:LuxR C-terminal-related transcriptional regulator [Cupriavidus sp. SK-4]